MHVSSAANKRWTLANDGTHEKGQEHMGGQVGRQAAQQAGRQTGLSHAGRQAGRQSRYREVDHAIQEMLMPDEQQHLTIAHIPVQPLPTALAPHAPNNTCPTQTWERVVGQRGVDAALHECAPIIVLDEAKPLQVRNAEEACACVASKVYMMILGR